MGEATQFLTDTVTKNGYRLTAARRAIIETLAVCAGHITADDLADKVREQAPQVGRMTVYRTLDLLCELGAIRPIYQGTGAAHYILMTDGSHHHLICNRCHDVIEFEHCTAGDLVQQLADRFNFQVSSHLLELHGLCAACRP
jgi:Fur family ferric uptake transcriptional regulator